MTMSVDDDPPLPSDVVADDAAAAAAASDAAAATTTTTTEAIPPSPIIFIRGLTILPPRQKKTKQQQHSNGALALPPLRPEEPVASLRGALGEIVGYAHLTRYRLVAERLQTGNKVDDDENSAVASRQRKQNQKRGTNQMHSQTHVFDWSPYTLKDADVDMSPSHRSLVARGGGCDVSTTEEEIVLDEYGDLSILLPLLEGKVVSDDNVATTAPAAAAAAAEDETSIAVVEGGDSGLQERQQILHYDAANTIAIRVVLERYDLASVCDHMAKVRNLLKGNAPYIVSLVGSEDSDEASGEKSDDGEKGDGGDTAASEVDRMTMVKGKKGENKTKKMSKKSGGDLNNKDVDIDTDDLNKKDKEEELAIKKAIADALPPFSPKAKTLFDLATNGDLTNFYYFACGEEQNLLRIMNETSGVNGSNGSRKMQPVSDDSTWMSEGSKRNNGSKGKNKKGNQSGDNGEHKTNKSDIADSTVDVCGGHMENIEHALYELNEAVHVSTTVSLSGYHPPPTHRVVLGDLAYLMATFPDGSVAHITACPLGFYLNRSTATKFDPTPSMKVGKNNSKDACYSHALLDCLLQCSSSLCLAWRSALTAAKKRSDLLHQLSLTEDTLYNLFRPVASSFSNNASGPAAATAMGGMMRVLLPVSSPSTFTPRIDSLVVRPPWLVSLPSVKEGDMIGPRRSTWDHDKLHSWDTDRVEDELTSVYGMDIRGGGLRDWNEELQTARELPVETIGERTERARLVHKVLSDFGDAALRGVKAILDGYIQPMNPNEPLRSHVYLHNNIFFSRALETGLDTFKVIQGDAAAKKSASRDANNMGVLHRLDIPGLHTLATVLVEYLGTRIVCQSVVPGILHGEKSHSILYGAVETLSELKCNEEMHKLLENSIGEDCMVATRTIPVYPFTDERMDDIKKTRALALPESEKTETNNADNNANGKDKSVQVCGPLEMKGILGSDQRKYVLDCTRLTPRDANWVCEESGGTGCWEDAHRNGAKSHKFVPSTLDDVEWTVCVLRQELVTHYAEMKICDFVKEKEGKVNLKDGQIEVEDKKEEPQIENEHSSTVNINEPSKDTDKEKEWVEVKKEGKGEVSHELMNKKSMSSPFAKLEEEFILSLRYNVNVFLPFTRSFETIDTNLQQLKKDEEEAREMARYLWNTVIPNFTKEIRSSSGNGLQMPSDGQSLTDVIHQRGINCRYLGRLAELAQKEEMDDILAYKIAAQSTTDDSSVEKIRAPRFRMPLCWLELLECEMVARAAKHVLNTYMIEQGPSIPAQTIASFLSAIMSVGEESAAETELRLSNSNSRLNKYLDQEDMNALTLSFDGDSDSGSVDAAMSTQNRGRAEIWSDIEREVGRRYRYNLSLYNVGSSKKDSGENRALYMPLLRRICQRSGIRLIAKQYAVGKKCVCGDGRGIGLTFPIAPTDILDVLPLVKHAAAESGETFIPCSFSSNTGGSFSKLHVLLSDAKSMYEIGQGSLSRRNFSAALVYAQEAAAMYQRVLETPIHPQISKCLRLIATAHFHNDEPDLALAVAAKYLAVTITLYGFDSAEVLIAHLTVADILLGTGKIVDGLKHVRAAHFLMAFMAGKHYASIAGQLYRLGSHYCDAGKLKDALHYFDLAASERSEDRMFDCLIARNSAGILVRLSQFKLAFEYEKKAYQLYTIYLGKEHDATKACSTSLLTIMQHAVEQEKNSLHKEKERVEENAAEAVAHQIIADEEVEEAKAKKKKKAKKKGKK